MTNKRVCKYCEEPLRKTRRIPLCVSCRVMGTTLFGVGAVAGGILLGILQKVFG